MKIGSLFSGIGGLDLAVEEFFNAETVWHCEYDKEPSKVLAARWPGVPNLGDVTKVDWSHVEPVDIMCGGFPCQDLSLAGRRAGMRPGTRSGLWADFRESIRIMCPSVVIVENVRGLLSGCAESDSDLEPCPGCLGVTKQHRPLVRALGRVLGDLAALGFNAEWQAVSASDVGAPHGRFRVFVVAYAQGLRFERGWPAWKRRAGSEDRSGGAPVALPPTPQAHDKQGGKTPERVEAMRARGFGVKNLNEVVINDLKLLPTPSASNPNDAEDIDGWSARRARVKEAAANGNGFGMPLGAAVRLLPTPVTTDQKGSRNSTAHRAKRGAHSGSTITDVLLPAPTTSNRSGNQVNSRGELLLPGIANLSTGGWAEYEPAIRLWESLTRPAPEPTRPDGQDGNHRLSPLLPEWMMGYPAGWVTDILDRNPAIKACGNGVVPQQAVRAIEVLWSRVLEVAA